MAEYLESTTDSSEEKAIDVRSLRGSQKEFNRLLADLKTEAGKAFKAICDRCVRLDYQKGETKSSWKEYANLLKEIKRHEVRHRKTNKLQGIMIDFACPRGHGVSLEITGDNYEKFLEQEKKKEEKPKEPKSPKEPKEPKSPKNPKDGKDDKNDGEDKD